MKTDRTIDEIVQKAREFYIYDEMNINDFQTWLKGEPSIEDLRRERPWKDIDVGEEVVSLGDARKICPDPTWEFTESLSPLGLEFARIVQWLNEGARTNNCGWTASPYGGEEIRFIFGTLPSQHRLHYGKDEATIKKAVEIFGEDQLRKMLGVK